ncbi:MAG: hypothetical protein H0W85_09290 [Methylotenera sp.]|nr:hypothetical protein [Methylotenera sp.]
MALTLHIPALKDKPIIIADTHPQRILQSLAHIHFENPLDIASHLHIELEILNRQKISPSQRLLALETYRPIIISTAHILAEEYINANLPLHDKAKLAAAATETLWLELGFGYKLALIDLQNQLIKLGTEKNSVLAILRAMHAIAEHAMVYYQIYIPPPKHIWSDLHQLYFCAVQLNIQHAEIDSTAELSISIENTYKHALLMSLADPLHLLQQNIRLVAEYLLYQVQAAQISAVEPLSDTAGIFIISLKSNEPPVAYSKYKTAPDESSDILLKTMDLVRNIHTHLNSLHHNRLPADGSIPADASRNDYIDLLTYLIKHWGLTFKRIFNRSQKNGEIELVAGIAAIHSMLDGQAKDAYAESLEVHAQNMPSRWQILNISPTGMSIRRHPTADKNIKIGGLLSVKTKDDANWSLAVVRWASCGTKERLDIGVQLIAPYAKPGMAKIDNRENDEMILLLPEIVATKQIATLILPKGTFEPARQLTVISNNQYQRVLLTSLIERAQYFERVQYSIIN